MKLPWIEQKRSIVADMSLSLSLSLLLPISLYMLSLIIRRRRFLSMTMRRNQGHDDDRVDQSWFQGGIVSL